MADSVYHDSYWEERLQLWVDNLNLLYVAFTRACKNLIIWGKANQRGTVSELLAEVAPQLNIWDTKTEETEETSPLTYTFGSLCPSENKKQEKGSENPLAVLPQSLPVQVESIETPIEFKQSNRSADFIRGDEDEEEHERYIRQGQLLHQVFASITTESDLPGVIKKLTFEGILESEEKACEIEELARWALNHPQVKDWYGGNWRLYNECSIIYTDETGTFQTRRPDRVMMKKDKVVVVDFKFGKKKNVYRQQVKEYMNLLIGMGYKNVEGYLWYVFGNELEKV